MECIVHIGDIKSGTTSIQAALAAGNTPYKKGTVAYPCEELNHNHVATLFKERNAHKRAFIKRIREQITASRNPNKIVISGEKLAQLPPEVVRDELQSSFGDLVSKFTVIHYIRPHLRRAVSAYSEVVKIGATEAQIRPFLRRSIKDGRWQCANRMKAWACVFGDSYISRKMHSPALHRRDVVVDFYETVIGPLPQNWTAPPYTNVSLSQEGIHHARRLQQCLAGRETVLRHSAGYDFEWRFSKIERRPIPAALPDCSIAALREAFAEDAAQVDAMFGGTTYTDELAREPKAKHTDQLEIQHSAEADAIIADILRAASSENDRVVGIRLRRDRARRYIAQAAPTLAVS